MRGGKIIFWGLVATGLGILPLGFYGVWIEPYQIDVRHVWIEDSKLSSVLKEKTLVQISDLHMNKIGRRERKVLKILDGIKPDIIFVTGDYITWKGDYGAALDFLSRLKAEVGVWAVMGDYDYSYSRNSCIFCHDTETGKPTKQHSVRFLRNSLEQVNLTDGSIFIGGIDLEANPPFFSKERSLPLKGKKPAIILSHNPLAFDLLDKDEDVLIISGDTHGGQVPLPSWLWGILGYEKCARYSQGLFEEGRKKMFVSRGIGTSHLPIRIFRRPEVVVLHFKP
jgi:predicted MPP superfamily phosphohydrolase